MDIYSEKKAMKDLNSLYAEAVYGKPKSAGQELASREKRDDAAGAPKKMIVTRADKKANTKAYQNYKAGAKGYAAADHLKNEEYAELYATMNGQKVPTTEAYGSKKKKKHDCASKVKHEEYGMGRCIPEMHDLDEHGNVVHYDVMFEHGVEKHIPVSSLEIVEGHMHEHVIREKMAAKDYDGDGKIESGKDEYFGSKDKAIKKAMGKKVKESNVKNKVVIDPEVKLEQALGGQVEVLESKNCGCGQDPCVTYGKGGKVEKENKIKEEILWDRVAEALDELGEMNDVQFKVSPMTEEEIIELNWDVFDENYQAMRNPEKEEKKDKRSAREKRMADPEKGINSPAFKEFMKQYGG